MDRLRFISFASGSSGNCYFLGTQLGGILIDAGISPRRIRRHLKTIGLDFENIYGVFITHDHADHIKGVGALGERYNIPIYSTQLIHKGIGKNYSVTQTLDSSKRYINKGEPLNVFEFKITAFQVAHDGTDNVGYFVEYGDKRFTIVTDIGCIDEFSEPYILRANYLVIEANHDVQMLKTGTYPNRLKKRISSNRGHLSNVAAGEFLANNFHSELKYIFLCHLSKDNNTPKIAYDTVHDCLHENGIQTGRDVELVVLTRTTPSDLYIFD